MGLYGGSGAWAVVCGLLALSGCSEPVATTPIEEGSTPIAAAPSGNELLRLRSVQARQKAVAADARYGWNGSNHRASDALLGNNPEHQLDLRFGSNGASISSARGFEVELSAAEVRCDERALGLSAPLGAAAADGNRAALRRRVGGTELEEWYVNGPLGLEQGFTLNSSPCAPQERTLSVEVGVEGLTPSLESEALSDGTREEVRLVDDDDQVRAIYSDWLAYDAAQEPLALKVATVAGRIVLQVDVSKATFPVTIDPIVWVQRNKVLGQTGAMVARGFAISGNTVLMEGQGGAFVYLLSGNNLTLQQKLTDLNGFGAVAIDGDTAVVGDSGFNSSDGRALVYVRSGTTWTLQETFVGGYPPGGTPAELGHSVALSGNTAVIGVPGFWGHARVFVRSGTTWTKQTEFVRSNTTDLGVGRSVAISGDMALVGTTSDYSAPGVVYQFERSGTVWTETQRILSADTGDYDHFGITLALSGNTALIGSTNGTNAVYAYTRSAGTWSFQQKLLPTAASDRFSSTSVALLGDTALIGGTDSMFEVAFTWGRSGTVWTEQTKLVPSDAKTNTFFGWGVGLAPRLALVGCSGLDFNTEKRGAIYLFGSGLAQGDACTTGSECITGKCVENVCCDTDCAGSCQSCLKARKASGNDGACGDVKAGTDPQNDCASSNVSTCGLDGSCNGAGACRYHALGSECAPASCPTPTSENHSDTCNGTGSCLVTAVAACNKGYVCAGGACNTNCDADSDCDQTRGYTCIGSECLIAKGSPCQAGDICETGHCADGVCCDSACGDECSACLLELTGESDGTCAVIPAGQDPEDECPEGAGYPESCGADGSCDGMAKCREYAIAGTPCGAPTMCANDQISGEVCNGTGTCSNDTVACGVYPCDAAMVACATSCSEDDDCSDIAYCITGGTCTEKKPNGAACAEARECGSQLCVDGVCCESSCEAQCASCAEPGKLGKCVAVEGEPRAGRAACAGGGDACQGACDGVSPDECSYPGATTVCARACSGDEQEQLSHCDGGGSCEQDQPSTCGNYLCRSDRCLSECSEDADCKNGSGCSSEGECIAKTGRCIEKNTMSQTNDGQIVPCAPYVCDSEPGACLTACESSSQCAADFACDTQSNTCRAATPATDDGSCACRAIGGAPAHQPRSAALALLGLCAALVLRRARRGKGIALAVAALGLAGCTDASSQAGSSTPVRSTPSAPSAALNDAAVQGRQALRRTRIRDLQSAAALDARYALSRPTRETHAPLSGKNPAFGLSFRFGRSGVELKSDQQFRVGLAAKTLRCDQQAHVLEEVPATISGEQNRASYPRQVNGQRLDEWYVNGPLGLEQGFTLAASPCPHDTTQLELELELGGLRPRLAREVSADGEQRERVELVDANGETRALYSDWFAYDAQQRSLPLSVAVEGDRLALRTDVAGAVYPITIDPLIWTEKKRLVATDRGPGASADFFGVSVALDGNTALIGANADNTYQGAAYVFARSGTVWTEQKKLLAKDGAPNDWFGLSVGLSGNTAIVGGYTAPNGGAAWVFVRSGNDWTEQKKLTPSDPGPAYRFGGGVAIDGDTAVVGAFGANDMGAAYVFVRSGTEWTQQKKLVAGDGASGDSFGTSVALKGDTAVVGAPNKASGAGAAYVFVRSGTTWTEQKKLLPSNGAANENFGHAVSVSGNTALVGARFHNSNKGGAYVFVRSGVNWTEQKALLGGDGSATSAFGWSVAVSGDTAAVGSRGDDGGRGAIYAYTRTGTTWTEQKKLIAGDRADLDALGVSVALSGDVAADRQYDILGGAQYDDNNWGAAYVFGMAYEDADACTKDEDCVSQHCVENVCCDTACSGTCKTCLASRKASGADGVCGNVKVNTDPRNACATADVATCGFEGTCNGSGACKYYANGTECGAASCPSATSQNRVDSCNGSGTCTVTADEPCGPGYLCAAGACKTSCTSNADCNTAAGYECDDGDCVIPLGEACLPTDSCATGHCVDGVCCESACAGACSACINDETGEPDGTCAFVLGGRDPRDECEPDAEYPASCREDGACDGQGACRLNAVAGTACGETSCSGGTVTGDICDGAGKCQKASAECAPYVCAGEACGDSCGSDQDCDESVAYCINGTCNDKKAAAAPCTESNECLTGSCADGVCCDRACAGQCEACDASGVCQLVEGEPRGEREACSGAGTACAGTCDGVDALACSYPSAGTECGRACSDARATVSSCDGSGSCVEGNPVSCETYLCGDDSCLTSCTDDSDCQDGYACKAEQCVIKGAKCLEGGTKSQSNEDDSVQSCEPYVCEPSTGECLSACRSSADCQAGTVCNAQSKACEVPTGAPQEDAGCGCRAVGGGGNRHGGSLLWLGVGLVLAARLRRRAQRALAA